MAVASYGSATDSSGVVRILKDLDAPIEGRDVLIVEDIVDSGLTLQYLLRNLGSRNPATLEVCALLTKPARRKVDLPTRTSASRSRTASRSATGSTTPSATATCRTWRRCAVGARMLVRHRGPRRTRASGARRNAPENRTLHGTLGHWWPRRQPAPETSDIAMSRFFKSAAFPILIVLVLAFFAVETGQPAARTTPARTTTRRSSRQRLPKGEVKSVEFKNKGKALDVTLTKDTRKVRSRLSSNRPSPQLISDSSKRPAGHAFNVESEKSSTLLSLLHVPAAVRALLRLLDLPDEPAPGRRLEGDVVRQVARQAAVGRLAEDQLPRRRRRRRGGRGAARDQGVPREPEEVPGARRADPDGRAALRAAGHRQDAARARGRRRGGRAVLLDLGLGLRRDVRRRRRLARARPLRAGQAEQPVHHLHGRDRRRRAPPRRRPRRRPRRARADAQPAARRDGRLRGEGQHHHDRGHQPARHPRPGAAAPRPLRPPDRRRPPRPQGPREDPRGAHARQAAGEGDRHRRARRPDARASPAPTSRT